MNHLTGAINDGNLFAWLAILVRRQPRGNDRGRVSDDFVLPHLTLQLQRSSQQQAALDQFTADVANPSSPSYHGWLMAQAFGALYGLSAPDLAVVTA